MRRYRRRRDELRIAEQAAEWLQELQAENIELNEPFTDWLLESPAHIKAFLRVAAVNASLSRIDPARAIEIVRSIAPEATTNVVHFSNEQFGVPLSDTRAAPVRPRSLQRCLWAAAASIVAVALLGAGAWMITWYEAQWQHYTTAIGEQRTIELGDGSTLVINTRSRLDVRYSKYEREVRVLAGEALFNVHRDTTRPFRVHVGGAVVQALGTQFNILRRPEGTVVVSVIEGQVRVDRDNRLLAALPVAVRNSLTSELAESAIGSADAPAPKADVVLRAGEESRVAEDGKIAAPSKADVEHVVAWRERRLVFVNQSLGTIASEFNRYNRIPQIKVEGAVANDRRYAALSFDANDPESLVRVLERNPSLQVLRDGDTIVVRAR